MNLFSLLGQNASGTFTDDTLGGPVQRLLNSHFALLNGINLANTYDNETRAARLNAFKTPWESKAAMIWGKTVTDDMPYSEAVQYSLDLAGEVTAALAVSD